MTMNDDRIVRPHELGMTVRVNAPRSSYHGKIGVIDEIAIYGTFAHGIDFTGWDLLVVFHDGASHSYTAFDFDEVEIIEAWQPPRSLGLGKDGPADLSEREGFGDGDRW